MTVHTMNIMEPIYVRTGVITMMKCITVGGIGISTIGIICLKHTMISDGGVQSVMNMKITIMEVIITVQTDVITTQIMSMRGAVMT